MKLSSVQKNQILDLASIYGEFTRKNHDDISFMATRRDDFFARLVHGADFTNGEPDRFIKWMSDHWPRGVVWPDHVARPVSPVVEAA